MLFTDVLHSTDAVLNSDSVPRHPSSYSRSVCLVSVIVSSGDAYKIHYSNLNIIVGRACMQLFILGGGVHPGASPGQKYGVDKHG